MGDKISDSDESISDYFVSLQQTQDMINSKSSLIIMRTEQEVKAVKVTRNVEKIIF